MIYTGRPQANELAKREEREMRTYDLLDKLNISYGRARYHGSRISDGAGARSFL